MTVDAVAQLVPGPAREVRPVSGGSISHAFRVLLDDGTPCFVKTHPAAPAGMFDAEARGLAWLRRAGVRSPEVIAVVDGPDAPVRGIVLEWLEPIRPATDRDEVLGRAVASLHRLRAPSWGFSHPGFIGDLPQPNDPAPTWAEFYADRRLRPMAAAAERAGALRADGRALVERVADRASVLVGEADGPSPLHGDLWAGNVLTGPDGHAWLVDPAAYGGHREVDLAMMRLFGGFSDRVFAAYGETHPLAEEWQERVGLYQLYPLLVHAVLFGSSYAERAVQVAGRYV